MALLFGVPVFAGVSLLRLSPGSFTIETVGFLAYRVFPAVFILLSVVLGLGWILARRPPRLSTLTLVAAVLVHACAGLVFFPQTYAILMIPMAGWAGVVVLLIGRLDWVAPPLFFGDPREEAIPLRPASESPPRTPEPEPDPPEEPDDRPEKPETTAIQERFQRLREELRPRPPEREYPRPSPLFLGTLAVIAGILSAVLLLPSAPSTVPLYGEQTEGFEAEPLWDPLLLTPKRTDPTNPDGQLPHRIWVPSAREPELPESWEQEMRSGSTRVVFSKRSDLVRVESPGSVANVNPLMEFPEVSADGFALLPWNEGSMAPGSATGWQVWKAGQWKAWVRYSGLPRIEGSWPPKTRRGVGPWLGKLALQMVPGTSIVSLSSVNRLNVALSARQADLCNLSIEPIREAKVHWGTVPDITDRLSERSLMWLHRTATNFVRRGHGFDDDGNPVVLDPEVRPRFQGWLIVRQPDKGPGFLICCPFWQRQIGIERPTHTPLGDPSNRISVSVEGLTTRIRFSLVAPDDPTGSTVSTVAPGTYLNVLLLVPVQQGEEDEDALAKLRDTLRQHAPPLLYQETFNLVGED